MINALTQSLQAATTLAAQQAAAQQQALALASGDPFEVAPATGTTAATTTGSTNPLQTLSSDIQSALLDLQSSTQSGGASSASQANDGTSTAIHHHHHHGGGGASEAASADAGTASP